MRYPKFLKSKDTIGFVAPSFGCNTEPYLSAFKNAQDIFSAKGYELELGPNCYEGKGIGISNTPEACGNELTDMYCSDTNDVLMSCGGGELMCETVSYTDYEAIAKAEPKWYIGYSDNTNFTFLVTTLCDVASIYGPCVSSFGMEPWHPSLTDAMDIMTGTKTSVSNYELWEIEKIKDDEHPLAPYNCTQPSCIKAYDSAGSPVEQLSVNGRLIGGCMDCLTNLTGTRFDKVDSFLEKYKDDGFIWFLEACDLNVFSIRRAMWQMYEAGWFKYCKGFLFGRPMHFDEGFMGLDQYEAVLYVSRLLGVPVIADCDIGHLPPSMPLICGSIGEVTYDYGKLSINMLLE